MMNTKNKGRLLAACAGATIVAFVALIAERNYRAAFDMFAPAPPQALSGRSQDPGITGIQEVAFHTRAGNTITGWYVPSTNRAAILVAHGTNDDRSSMLAEIRLLAGAGFGVLAFDWPGLGGSGGAIRWDSGAQEALAAAVPWLAAHSDVDASRIGGLGFSMGGVMLTRFAASDTRIRALVLEGTPSNFDDYVAYHHGRWGPLSRWPARLALSHSDLLERRLAPDRLIGSIAPRPVLIIGGDRDLEVPQDQVRALYSAARDPKQLWIVPGTGHGHYSQVAAQDYANRLLGFYRSAL